MLVITHFAGTDAERLETALRVLAVRPGYRRGRAARSTDDAGAWVLVTEWDSVGDYRRALGNYDVKLHATPVLAGALDLPGAFEELLEIGADGSVRRGHSDLAVGPDGAASDP